MASTSLAHGLLRLVGRSDLIDTEARGRLHIIIRNLLPHPSSHEDLSSFTAYMAVRHPFQRILSAYRWGLFTSYSRHNVLILLINFANVIGRSEATVGNLGYADPES